MLKITPLSFEWLLPSKMESHPLIWMLNFDGLPMDVRRAPREFQVLAYNKGLIPYIPADRRQEK